jgi:hypothetical protein
MKTPLRIRLRRLIWAPLKLHAHYQVYRWKRQLARTPEVQARLLEVLLDLVRDTDFGRDYGLARIRTIEDLRKALPVAGYERVEPYIERMKRGEKGVLLPPDTRIHMFAMTSGTTGTPKYIPVTDFILKTYRHGWHVWGVHALDDHHDAFGTKILQLASRMDEQTTPSGIPAGAMSGFTAYVQHPLVRQLYVVPPEGSRAGSAATKYYLACRLGLQERRVMPMTANPSTLLSLAKTMDERKESLLRDVADGTLAKDLAFEPDVRRSLEARLRPQRRRARELEACIRASGHLYPKDAWDVPLINTWKGGTLTLYLRELPEYWGDAPIRDVGLIASEGRFSIPVQTPGSAGVLEVIGTYFEFVPEEEIDAPQPRALLAHEVEIGRKYFIIITTPSGLVRYHIGDLVKVVGRMGLCPIIEFLNKGQHIANLTGEKITEFQVVSAVNTALDLLHLEVHNYCLAPSWDKVPYYSLLVEESDLPAGRAVELAAAVDKVLRALNIEYETKRSSRRLRAIRVKTVPAGEWHHFDGREIASRGERIEQYKHKFLVNQVDFEKSFTIRGCYAPPDEA